MFTQLFALIFFLSILYVILYFIYRIFKYFHSRIKYKEKVRKLIVELHNKNNQLQRYEIQVENLKNEIKNYNILVNKMKQAIYNLKEENAQLKRYEIQVETYKNVIKKYNTVVNRMKQAIYDLNEENDQYNMDLELNDKIKKKLMILDKIKRLISGYGDDYIAISQSIIDNIANQYDSASVSKKYKIAKQYTKKLIKENKAVISSISNNSLNQLLLFAFNTKVDQIVNKVKIENIGKLKAEIKDLYDFLNHLSEPFYKTQILTDYLKAKLKELNYAYALVILKNKERDEQRIIKEKIKEEARLQKEYKDKIQQTAKEEAKIKAALDQVKSELLKASEEQKRSYELELKKLEDKLHTAEERNKRAISMAQKTKAGYVYIISNIGSFGEDVYKIGMTRRLEPLDRISELSNASVPFSFDVHAMIYSEDAPNLEYELHKRFNENRINKINPRKEFYRIKLSDIQSEVNKMGLSVEFTLLAKASEFRETQAMANLSLEEKTEQLNRLIAEDKKLIDLNTEE